MQCNKYIIINVLLLQLKNTFKYYNMINAVHTKTIHRKENLNMTTNNENKKTIKEGDSVSIRFPKSVNKNIIEWANKQTSITNSILKLIEKEVTENGIKDLSKEPPIPTQKELLPFVFECIGANNNTPNGVNVQIIYDYCTMKLNVSPAQRSEPSKANSSKFENRVRFAILELKNKNLIESGPKRGYYKLTNLGQFFYNKRGEIDIRDFDDIIKANFLNESIKNTY